MLAILSKPQCVQENTLESAFCPSSPAAILEIMVSMVTYCRVNTLRPRKNGWHFPDDIFKPLSLNENVWISIKISLKFVLRGPINNIPALVEIMALCEPGHKSLSQPMMVSLLCIYVSLGLSVLIWSLKTVLNQTKLKLCIPKCRPQWLAAVTRPLVSNQQHGSVSPPVLWFDKSL